MKEKYLPLGTVVLLKEAKKRIMIIGYAAKAEESNKLYDYIGCLYPEGVVSSDKNLLFNHDKIEKVFHKGYKDDEAIEFNAKLKLLVTKIDSGEIEL